MFQLKEVILLKMIPLDFLSFSWQIHQVHMNVRNIMEGAKVSQFLFTEVAGIRRFMYRASCNMAHELLSSDCFLHQVNSGSRVALDESHATL